MSALHICCENGDAGSVAMLVSAGCALDLQMEVGATPQDCIWPIYDGAESKSAPEDV